MEGQYILIDSKNEGEEMNSLQDNHYKEKKPAETVQFLKKGQMNLDWKLKKSGQMKVILEHIP